MTHSNVPVGSEVSKMPETLEIKNPSN